MTDMERDIFFGEIQPWAEALGKTFENKKDMIEDFWINNLPESDYAIKDDGDYEPFIQYDYQEDYTV